MAGDGLAGVLAQVVPQVPAVRDLDRARRAGPGGLGVGAPPVPADHLAPPDARAATPPAWPPPGPAARPPACRPPCPPAPSRTCWPLRSEKSSTPSTRTSPAGGSGSAPSIRTSVCRLTSTASTRRPAGTRPARPAPPPTAVSSRASSGVFRAYGAASPAGCSAKLPRAPRVRRTQQPHPQPDHHPAAADPGIIAAAATYRPRTFVHHIPHPGHAAPSGRGTHPDAHQVPADNGPVHGRHGQIRQQQPQHPGLPPDKHTLTCDTDTAGLPGSERLDTAGLPGAPPATKTTLRKPRKTASPVTQNAPAAQPLPPRRHPEICDRAPRRGVNAHDETSAAFWLPGGSARRPLASQPVYPLMSRFRPRISSKITCCPRRTGSSRP